MNEIIWEDAKRVLERVDLSSLAGKRVLVTGATGLLGTHFLATIALMNQRGAGIRVFGFYNREPEEHTKDIATKGNIVLLDSDYQRPLPADVIIHAAGYAQPAVFTANPVETIRVNTTWTSNLLQGLYTHGSFLFISSSEVYSGLGGLVTESSIGNTTPLHPRACYIEGKRCGEAIVNACRETGVYNVKSARLSLAYGPGYRHDDQRAMSHFIRQALVNKGIRMEYSGREPRTFCYISDAVEVLWNVLLHGKQAVYNVGGEPVTNMAGVAMHIAQQTGVWLNIPSEETTLPGAPLVVSMDLTRMKTEFGKKDFVSLEDGLKQTIEWARGIYV